MDFSRLEQMAAYDVRRLRTNELVDLLDELNTAEAPLGDDVLYRAAYNYYVFANTQKFQKELERRRNQ